MKRAAFASNIVNVSVAMFQRFINVCSGFFYKKRKKNGICTKCLLISKKYIYVATGVSPVKDCKKNKKLTKKRFLLPINVRWCSRSCGQMHCSDTPVCSVCIQHKPTDMRHYLSYSTLPIFQLNH